MSKTVPPRADFMSANHKAQMGKHPRTHTNCKMFTGVNRPGKTRRDRALKNRD